MAEIKFVAPPSSEPVFMAGFLSDADKNTLTDLQAQLSENWAKRQVFRTETEMVVSVLNDAHFPTPAAKYWQCVREQAGMLDQLAIAGFAYRRNEIKLKRHQDRLAELPASDQMDREECQVDIDECLYQRAAMRQTAADRVRELRLWGDLMRNLDDGSFNTEDVNVSQLQGLLERFQNQAATLSAGGASQAEAMNCIGQLKTAQRVAQQATAVEGRSAVKIPFYVGA